MSLTSRTDAPPCSRVRSPRPQRHTSQKRWSWAKKLMLGLTVCCGVGFASPAVAAERLSLKLGPIRQTVDIDELEKFAITGEVPSALRLYKPLLNDSTQQALGSHLQIDPNVGEKLIEDLLYSSAGERLVQVLKLVIPNSNASKIQTALVRSARQSEGLSLLGFMRSFPADEITVDVGSVVALASQMNLPYWQSQVLSSMLERELTNEVEAFDAPFDPTRPGEYWVRQRSLVFQDHDRERAIPADLYWSRNTHGPLVVISHGFGADRRFLGYLAQHLASHGLAVVALEHPGSNVAWLTGDVNKSILPATEYIDRPKDITFLLDELSRLNRFSPTLRDKFNTDQTMVIGHSLGGYTALALAGAEVNLEHLRQFCNTPSTIMLAPADLLQCNASDLPNHRLNLQDQRVKQVIALNPVIGRLFDEDSLAQIEVPVMIVAGTEDTITPAVSQQFLPFTQLRSPKYLLTAIGATHLSVGDPANLNHALTQSIFMRELHNEETEPLRLLLRGVSLAFAEQMTPQAERYRPFLSTAYAQQFSHDDLKLSLSSELSPKLSHWLTMTALPLEQLVASTLPIPKPGDLGEGCVANRNCLWSRLPFLMFILPGQLPPWGNPLFQLSQLDRKKRRRKRLKAARKPTDQQDA